MRMFSPGRMPTFCALAALVLMAGALSACKSRTRRSTVASTATAPAPNMVAQQPSYPDYVPANDYPPPPALPAPTMSSTNGAQAAPSGVSQSDYEAAVAQTEVERRRGEELARKLDVTEGQIQALSRRLDEYDTPPDLAGGRPVAQPTIGDVNQLFNELRAKTSADVTRDGDMIIVRFTNSFKAGSDKLKGDVQLMTTLNATASALGDYPGATVAVVGHSDGDPIKKSPWQSNDALSMARAQRVAQVLADNGVNGNRISIDGRGDRELLISPELSRSDKARNRRVEIMIRP